MWVWRDAEDGGPSRCRGGSSRVGVLGSRGYVADRVEGTQTESQTEISNLEIHVDWSLNSEFILVDGDPSMPICRSRYM